MQATFSDLEYAAKKKVARRDRFPGEIDTTPRSALVTRIKPFYPKGEGRGRPPIGLERIPRTYVARQCFGLSGEGTEDAIYGSQATRGFIGVDLARGSAPDATTPPKFRRPPEKRQLTGRIFTAINEHLAIRGLLPGEGTVVGATIIAAPSPTKNRKGERDQERRQTKKGNRWRFGVKAHIGADAGSGPAHTLVTAPANTNDVAQAHALLHGEERIAFGDAGYQGAEKREENRTPSVKWHVAMRPGKRRALPGDEIGRIGEKIEKFKASVRAKVEHPFHIIKNLFRLKRVRYRGPPKNTAQLLALFGLANLLIAGLRLFALHAQGVP
ncbi:MAG: IS5 family transposase [Betaproteobacteria bacterium]|nr:IS5 family transposase [Betaproteobacteria bacterium]